MNENKLDRRPNLKEHLQGSILCLVGCELGMEKTEGREKKMKEDTHFMWTSLDTQSQGQGTPLSLLQQALSPALFLIHRFFSKKNITFLLGF